MKKQLIGLTAVAALALGMTGCASARSFEEDDGPPPISVDENTNIVDGVTLIKKINLDELEPGIYTLCNGATELYFVYGLIAIGNRGYNGVNSIAVASTTSPNCPAQ